MIMYFSCNNRGYYVWQKSHQSKLIRFDLRTRDFNQASHRSKVLLSAYYRLKQSKVDFIHLREQLIAVRDSCIELQAHFEANIMSSGVHPFPNSLNSTTAVTERKIIHRISDVAKEWREEMDAQWRPLTAKANMSAANLFIEWFGNKDILTVSKTTVSQFKKTLDERYSSERSKQSCMKKVTALFGFATNKRDYLPRNPFSGMNYKNVKNLRSKSPISLELHNRASALVDEKSSFWWLLQILYFTGMRITETIQLTIDDYVEFNDGTETIPCISINDTEGKRVKNRSSIRLVPLHKTLLTMGLFAEKPTFRWNQHNAPSALVSKLYKMFNEGQHTAHDYRYGMSDRLRDIEQLPDHVRFSILGHSSQVITDSIYRGKLPLILMRKAIDLT
ncbi:tyrosine-type recombinase/integrase [Yersinia massiliensis]|uniref:tyrosine-type recombinase/integrase n=1 Tax=Yersinia massiliensis TaxID=419257 RepID=UPI001551D41C|nr:tyrosine-type recombinase/integrase [Yersinia massiliensis]